MTYRFSVIRTGDDQAHVLEHHVVNAIEAGHHFMRMLPPREGAQSLADHLAGVAHFVDQLTALDAGLSVSGVAVVSSGNPRVTRATVGLTFRDEMLTYTDSVAVMIEGVPPCTP